MSKIHLKKKIFYHESAKIRKHEKNIKFRACPISCFYDYTQRHNWLRITSFRRKPESTSFLDAGSRPA